MNRVSQFFRQLMPHDNARSLGLRFFLALLVLACTLMLLAWLHIPLNLIWGALIGLASYVAIDLALLEKSDRIARIDKAISFCREHTTIIIRLFAWVAFILLFELSRVTPTDPVILAIEQQVSFFGLFIIAMIPLLESISFLRDTSSLTWLPNTVTKVIRYLAVYTSTLWLIGHAGTETKEWIQTNPQEFIVASASVIILIAMMYFSSTLSRPTRTEVYQQVSALPAGRWLPVNRDTTPRDKELIRAHEIGHAIQYAALGRLPDEFKVVVKDSTDDSGSLGFVTRIESENTVKSKALMEWEMMVYLGGKIGEDIGCGETSLGCTADHQRWLSLAKDYLSNHYDGIYFQQPESDYEHRHNMHLLESLQLKQSTLVRQFIEINLEVFRSLIRELEAKSELNKDDVTPQFCKVIIPDGYPLPFGQFDVFQDDRVMMVSLEGTL